MTPKYKTNSYHESILGLKTQVGPEAGRKAITQVLNSLVQEQQECRGPGPGSPCQLAPVSIPVIQPRQTGPVSVTIARI